MYTTKGSVRGCCGHKHRSLKTAFICITKDTNGCNSQGGYSDRYIQRLDGEELEVSEQKILDSLERGY